MKHLNILCLAAALCLVAACRKPEPVVIPVSKMEFEPADISLFVGEKQEVVLQCYPQNATNLEDLTIQNSNNKVASFIDGLLTALSPGRTQLTARCDKVLATAVVTVYGGWFTKGGQKYGVDKAAGYYYMMGEKDPVTMDITLTFFQQNGDSQNFWILFPYNKLGKTINFLEDMTDCMAAVFMNNNEDGYTVAYYSEDEGRPVIVTADWSHTDATLTKGLLTVTDLGGGNFKIEADFALSNGYTFTASWEGAPAMQKEG